MGRHDGAGSDHRACTDPDAPEDNRTRADRCAALDDGWQELPVRFALQLSCLVRRAGMLVVNEDHAMPDEHLVADGHPLADEGVALDLAARADRATPLDLDERTYT